MKMKKMILVSAMALAFTGGAHAIDISAATATTATMTELNALITAIGTNGVTAPEVSALSGAINTAVVNGAIDISGTNVSLSSMANNVSAKAEAIATNSSATAYAIAGAKLSTTVIGAMNSATLDIQSKSTNLDATVKSQLGVASLAADGTGTSVTGPTIAGLTGLTGNLTGSDLLNSVGSVNLNGLTSQVDLMGKSMVNELQAMNVFNSAINVASLDAGIKIAATVDPNAWFLNPQSGIVNLSNIEMATTAIGAMNSSVTRLGQNLATVTTVKP